MELSRLIGRYTGPENGPLLIVFGGMHGNEPAGVQALERMFEMLKVEPDNNPKFNYKGRIVGMRGNLRAMQLQQRFIEKDLNRQFTAENIKRIQSAPDSELDSEDKEVKEILAFVDAEIADYQPEKVVFLDIHTTTAFGGIFGISTDQAESLRIAVELHAPVITGMMNGIRGTSLHHFCEKNYGRNAIAVVFEAGQHDEGLSTNRAIAAITNCMRTIGSVEKDDVENRHDDLLITYSKNLPKVAELLKVHRIHSGDNFEMVPNYKNFQRIKKGDILATDKHGVIRTDIDGMILMPLYQKQGEDGFFLIKEVEYKNGRRLTAQRVGITQQ
ncbi:MAG: succinylglutamate desuccinylase [Paraglaciecola sp.]|jgi:succinylglutamate desuccinylase